MFENAHTFESLSKQGNPLEFVSGIVDFEMFRPIIESKLQTTERKSNAGRRPIDPVLKFKVMFVQRLYGLSDETSASVHDSQRGAELIDSNDIVGEVFWLDAGHVGTDDNFTNRGMTPIICEKGFRGHPLNEEQKRNNRSKSKIRCRVEHAFGFIERSMGGLVFREIGIVRAKANVAMTNLTYNIAHLTQIYRYHK